MKKKLIAAILSLAMVASMVPATAFATTDGQADVKTTAAQNQNAQAKAISPGLDLDATTPVKVEKGVAGTGAPAADTGFDTAAYTNSSNPIVTITTTTRMSKDGIAYVKITAPNSVTTATGKTWSVECLADGKVIAKTAATPVGTSAIDGIPVTKDTDKLRINLITDADNISYAEISVTGKSIYAGNTTKVDDIIKILDEKYKSSKDSTVTYADYAKLKAFDEQITNLTSGEREDLSSIKVADTEKGYFDATFNDVKSYKQTIDDAKKAINDIPKTELNPSNESDVKTAEGKVNAVSALTATKWGIDPTTGVAYTVKSVIGEATYQLYEDALNIMKVVVAIKDMPKVDSTNYSSYETGVGKVTIDKVDALDITLHSRVGNMNIYDQNINRAKNATKLINSANVAIEDASSAATPDKPYTEAKVEIAKEKKLAAITAMEAVGSDLAGGNWTTWQTALGNDKADYTAGTIGSKIVALEEKVENEIVAAPVIKLIQVMPAADKLAWTDKDAMFEMTTAFEELEGTVAPSSTGVKGFIKDQYKTEYAKFVALENAQKTVEEGNLQLAINRLTTQINALPTTVTLDDEDAIELVKSAVGEYTTGYLKTVPVYSKLANDVKTKYTTAVNGLKTLTDVRDAEDKVAVKPFVKLVGDLPAVGALKPSDKVLVEEARAAYDKLTKSQQKLVENEFKTLEKAEKKIADLESAKDPDALANGVKVAVRALPDAAKLAITDAAQVYAANDKYLEAIKTEGVKDKIGSTYQTTLFTAVGKVMDLEIAALPTLKADGTDTKAEIDAAAEKINAVKATYDKIGTDQQKQVTKKAALDAAVAALDKAIIAHSDAELKAIAAFDFEKELTAEQLAQIKAEKACIDAMTKEQIAKLNQDNYKIFTEKALPALEASEEATTSLENAKIEELKNVVYNGKAHTPAIKVTGKDGKEIAAENYTVKYYSNKNVGQATVVVTAKKGGAYTGAVEATFIITPAKASITSLQVAKAKLRVNIKPMSGVNYRIAYKLTSAKSYKGQNTSLTSKVLPGIKAKKKYTVKVRAYIKEGGKTYFGAYSPIKHATTK